MIDFRTSFGRVAVGLRYSKPATVFMESWTRLIQSGLRPGDVVLPIIGDTYHHFAAETLAHHFLKTDCETLLFIDDDQGFPPDTLHKLRDNPENLAFDVVSALYTTRRPPYRPLVMRYDPADNEYRMFTPAMPRGAEAVNLVGLGFTLVRRSILEKVKAENKGKLLFCCPDTGDGEDAYFCLSVHRAGGRVAVDTSVCIAHCFHGQLFMSESTPEISMTGEYTFAFNERMRELKAEKLEIIRAAESDKS